jgi:hypothetical protein
MRAAVGVQAVARYGGELWWYPKEVGRRDYLQLFFNPHARSVRGALPTTPRGALMTESGLTPAAVISDSRQQRFAARLANPSSSNLEELQEDPWSSTPISRVVETEHSHRRSTEALSLLPLGEEPVVKSIILDDKWTAKRAAQRWVRETAAKVRAGVWMWWTDRSRSDDGRVGASAVCKHGTEWRTSHRYLGTGRMEVLDAELWAIGIALGETVKRRESLLEHGVKTVAFISDSQGAIRQVAHLELGLGQRLVRRIKQSVRALHAHGIATETHWVPGHFGIPANEDGDCQANITRDAIGSTAIERPYTSDLNSAGRIPEWRSAAKVELEANKCGKHFSYRLKGMMGMKRPVPMTSVTARATRFYRLKCGHAPTGVYLKRFGHWEDDKCW